MSHTSTYPITLSNIINVCDFLLKFYNFIIAQVLGNIDKELAIME